MAVCTVCLPAGGVRVGGLHKEGVRDRGGVGSAVGGLRKGA